MPLTLPSDVVIAEIHDNVTQVTSRVDIYEAGGTTLWYANAPFIDGRVSIDSTRAERRTASVTFENTNGIFKSDAEGFWYDKVLKLYRGISYLDSGGTRQYWERQLGEFIPDTINEDDFPRTVAVGMRDQTKKLLKAKFATSTEFASGSPMENVISAIAVAGGIDITKIGFTLTGVNTTRTFLFDRTTERWKAMSQIANAYNYDLYFDSTGILRLTEFEDPADPGVSPAEYRFEPGNGTNRVPNPGFETPLTGDNSRAAGWAYDYNATGGSVFALVNTGQYKDERALSVANSTVQGTSIASKSIPVVPGELWQVQAAVKANKVQGNGFYLRVVFHTIEDGTFAGAISQSDVVTNGPFSTEWTESSGIVTVPATANFMRVLLYAWVTGDSYTAYFDEVSAIKTYPLNSNTGNLASFSRATADERLYNHVVVTGEAANTLPVYAEAENTLASSPTRIARLGRRTYFYTSPFIDTVLQAQDVADRFLSIHALEQYEVNVEAIVVPYLDAPIIVEYLDPVPPASGPIRYLLSSIEIPLGTGLMTAVAKRVTVVG